MQLPGSPPRGRQGPRIARFFGILWMVVGVGIAVGALTGKIKSGVPGNAGLPYLIAVTVIVYGLFRFLHGSLARNRDGN